MTVDEVRDLLRKACARAGSQRAWSRQHELSASYVSDVLLGRREPAGRHLRGVGVGA